MAFVRLFLDVLNWTIYLFDSWENFLTYSLSHSSIRHRHVARHKDPPPPHEKNPGYVPETYYICLPIGLFFLTFINNFFFPKYVMNCIFVIFIFYFYLLIDFLVWINPDTNWFICLIDELKHFLENCHRFIYIAKM